MFQRTPPGDMASSSGVQKNTLGSYISLDPQIPVMTDMLSAASYAPTPHAIDALMQALDDDAAIIKKEPEPDAVDDETPCTMALGGLPRVHDPQIEPEAVDGVIPVVKQEPDMAPAAGVANMTDSDAGAHHCSDASMDDEVKDDSRSRVSSISDLDSDSGTLPKGTLNREVKLFGDARFDYNAIVRGVEIKSETKHNQSHDVSIPNIQINKEILKIAQKTFNKFNKGIINGNSSRAAFEAKLPVQDREVYLQYLGHLKGLDGFEWTNYCRISLPALATTAFSRSHDQERQLIEALRLYRIPKEVLIYVNTIEPESGLDQRAKRINVKLQRDMEKLANEKAAQLAKEKASKIAKHEASQVLRRQVPQHANQMAGPEQMEARQLLRKKEAQEQKKRSAQWMVEQLLKEETDQAQRRSRLLQDQKADLVKEGIETRRRLAPRRLVSESESFLIGRLVIEERTPEGAAEFLRWANAKMNRDEKEEYNRMLWIVKGQEAKGKMLVIPGGSEMSHLLS